MNESSEADRAAATAEIMRMLDEVGEAFEDAFSRGRQFLPVRINMPAEWPRQLMN
jgi:hypothetical protein